VAINLASLLADQHGLTASKVSRFTTRAGVHVINPNIPRTQANTSSAYLSRSIQINTFSLPLVPLVKSRLRASRTYPSRINQHRPITPLVSMSTPMLWHTDYQLYLSRTAQSRIFLQLMSPSVPLLPIPSVKFPNPAHRARVIRTPLRPTYLRHWYQSQRP
jgi:hypothetical protein